MAFVIDPTPYPEINALLRELLASVQAILGNHFVGMYVEGSLANGDFDQDSDVDFVVVTDEDISSEEFAALHAMHARIAAMDSPWAIQLEGSYLSRHTLRRHDPAHMMHPNIERGRGEQLKLKLHDAGWVVHRAILCERGITLVGPDPHTLIDPISPADLRQPMRGLLQIWSNEILAEPIWISQRGGQSYVVLSFCRMLYTLQHSAIVSKRAAARWAQETLGPQWSPLIERAWDARHNPDAPATPEDVNETLGFIRFALTQT